MNLTFNELQDAESSIAKVLHSEKITDFDDAIAIGEMEPDVLKALKLLETGKLTINKPYVARAEERSNSLRPDGYNTQTEMLELKEKMDEKLDTICPIPLKFPTLKTETIKTMFKDDSKFKLTAHDLKQLKVIGMIAEDKK